MAKNTICVYKSRLNILPNNPSKIAQRLLNCCQSGEISPNLVTLLPSLPPHFVCFCFASRTGLSILHFKRFHFEKENTRYRCYYYDLYYFFYFFLSPFVISSIGPPPTSVTRFGEILPLGLTLKKLGKIFRVYIVFGKILNLL